LSSNKEDRRKVYEETKKVEFQKLCNLVICPPTLVGHWVDEISKYANNLTPIQYSGKQSNRKSILDDIDNYDVIIMSYDILRNDIDQISKINFNFAILDEGHIIRNSKTKVSKAVKNIAANHRLILSGTPIQNNVLELCTN
jgi:TATA-binding protein-associated factor